ncbi:Uncharacterised protein [Budvicia aquatica]|uniref:Uncharacterized protein n=1 Tax=Budvicia aquatica TaxID=82979 RepID=A0A2C6DMI7_9GAMM|nr:hypothetical protein CRN84_20515 [Budvicia aquatica]VFS52032.1 Uncharacterised protein [Budvicia aquatica]
MYTAAALMAILVTLAVSSVIAGIITAVLKEVFNKNRSVLIFTTSLFIIFLTILSILFDGPTQALSILFEVIAALF